MHRRSRIATFARLCAAIVFASPFACSLINSPEDPVDPVPPMTGCVMDAECPAPSDCIVGVCNDDGTCAVTDAALGVECDEDDGVVCDGQGSCVVLCEDLVVSGEETDTDCGGPDCPACQDGLNCNEYSDCLSQFCNRGTCDECTQPEDCTAVDGGANCVNGNCIDKSPDGDDCDDDSDCSSDVCQDGICCDSMCPAGACGGCQVEGSEGTCTIASAGAAGSPACPAAVCTGDYTTCVRSCTVAADCDSGFCADGVCCNSACTGPCERCDSEGAVGTCQIAPDGAVGEFDPVSGESECMELACAGLSTCPALCIGDLDCIAGRICVAGNCQPKPAGDCFDGIPNGNETGVDCGGPDCAQNCVQGTPCRRGSDCASTFCVDGFCCSSACTGSCQACSVAEGGSSNGACQSIMQLQPCDDGWACTTGSTCNGGQCTGSMMSPNLVVYLSEDFADNDAGWDLGTLEWQIGPAASSPQGSYFELPELFGDPSFDHSAIANNGIAGAVIGGNVGQALHDFYWLTSPPIDTSKAGSLSLEYYRWLVSDFAPAGSAYMNNRVEVFDGSAWVTLWESAPDAVLDRRWTYQVHDISQYANDALQVRFGYDVGSGGVFSMPGWNLDDVLIASSPCDPE